MLYSFNFIGVIKGEERRGFSETENCRQPPMTHCVRYVIYAIMHGNRGPCNYVSKSIRTMVNMKKVRVHWVIVAHPLKCPDNILMN